MSNENPADSGGGNPSEKSDRSQDSVLAEMNRKTSKLAEENAALNQKLEQLAAMLTKNQAGSAPSGSEDDNNLEELIYKDPKAYAKAVRVQAERAANDAVNSRLQTQNETQTVLSQLAADYPELNDANSDLTKKAVEIYNALPANQRSNPLAYKIAVRDAAADMGVLVKSKRSKNNDDFVMSSGNSGSKPSSSSKDSAAGKLDSTQLAFAELVGLNIKDEKVVKRLQERSKRKSWNRWE